MRDGFYSVSLAGNEEDEHDHLDGFGVAMLVHLKDARFVGVDNGGCKVSGDLDPMPDGRLAMHLVYEFKCGSHMPDGSVLEADRTIEADEVYGADVGDGAPQEVNIGFGPMHVRMAWLAEPA